MTTLELIPSTLEGKIIATNDGWTNESIYATEKYKFKSLGEMNCRLCRYVESDLFQKNSIFELTEGKFPIDSCLDLYEHSNKHHTIGGKQVRLVGYSSSSTKNLFNKNVKPTITVE